MSGTLFTLPRYIPVSSTGRPYPLSTLTFYQAGTTTLATVYTTSALSVAHSNPLTSNSAGLFPAVYLSPSLGYSYKAVLKNAAGSTLWTEDVIPTGPSLTGASVGAALYPRTAGEIAAAVTPSDYSYAPGNALRYGAIASNVNGDIATNNAAIDEALSSLGATGGTVTVPRGVRFELSSLTLPIRANIDHWKDDDQSEETGEAYYSGLGTNERVNFMANANAGGIVNEDRIEGTFHPAHVINLRKNLTIHDTYLGAGQDRLDPARASYNILNEGLDWWRVAAQHYADGRSIFSGVTMHAWCPRVSLYGILTASYTAGAPALYATITGNTSGATGYFLASDTSATVVAWVSGEFVVGETVNYGGVNDTTDTITIVTAENLTGQPLNFDNVNGGVTIGLPAGTCAKTLGVGGDVVITPTREASQRFPEGTATTLPTLWLSTSLEDATVYGFGVAYDTTPAAANRRLRVRKWGEATMRGQVGAVQAKVSFAHSAAIETSALNIASITPGATGKYAVAFTTALPRADYAIVIGNTGVADRTIWANRTVNGFEIWNYNYDASPALANLTAEVSVVCVCGDI